MKRLSCMLVIAILALSMLSIVAPIAHSIRTNTHGTVGATAVTYMNVVNPLDGTHNFNFTTAQKSVDDAFIVNLTLVNVTNLWSWQIACQWNPSLLSFLNISVPSSNIFGSQTIITAGPDTSIPGLVVYGAALNVGGTPCNGSGTMTQVALKIIKSSGQCPLAFEGIETDTFLTAYDLSDIPFTPVNGAYRYNVVPASTAVYFNLNPNPVTVGNTLVLKGILIDSVSNPVKSQNVQLYARPLTGSWTYVASVQTNGYGIFSWQVTIPSVPKGTYIFAAYYPGSQTYKSTYNFAVLLIQ